MGLDHSIRRHPTRYQLVRYAESMVDRGAPVSAIMAAHISACPACAAEVKSMRASLEFTAKAGDLEPSNDLTAQILLRAKQARVASHPRPRSAFRTACRGIFFTGALAAMATVVFGMALGSPQPTPRVETALQQVSDALPSPDMLRKVAAEVKTLGTAVRTASANKPKSLMEREHLRAVNAMDADIVAAQAALQRNPGCTRASHIVNANLQRQAETLRHLYIERPL
jgi:hypothetical protein